MSNSTVTSRHITDVALAMPESLKSNTRLSNSRASLASTVNERVGYKIKVLTGLGESKIRQLACRVYGSNSRTRKISLPLNNGYGKRCFSENATDEFYVTGKDVGTITGCELFLKSQNEKLDWTISKFEAMKSGDENEIFTMENERIRSKDVKNKPYLLGTTELQSDHSASDFDAYQSREDLVFEKMELPDDQVFSAAPELNDIVAATAASSPPLVEVVDSSTPVNSSREITPEPTPRSVNNTVNEDPGRSFNWKSLDISTMSKGSNSTVLSEENGYKISFGTGNQKDITGSTGFNVQLFGDRAKSKVLKLNANLHEDQLVTFSLPPDKVEDIRYLTVASSQSYAIDYFEVRRESKVTFLVPLTPRKPEISPEIFVPGCQYKIKMVTPSGLNVSMRLHGENGKTDWLDNTALENSVYQGDMLRLTFTGKDVGTVTGFELRNESPENGSTLSDVEVQKCTSTSRSHDNSEYHWGEIYLFAHSVVLNPAESITMDVHRMETRQPLKERSLNTILEDSVDMDREEKYQIVLGYDIDGIWKGGFSVTLYGKENHCNARFGDHKKSASADNIINNKTVMEHEFNHPYLGELEHLVIKQNIYKVTKWPFEYIWVKHSDNDGQVRPLIFGYNAWCLDVMLVAKKS